MYKVPTLPGVVVVSVTDVTAAAGAVCGAGAGTTGAVVGDAQPNVKNKTQATADLRGSIQCVPFARLVMEVSHERAQLWRGRKRYRSHRIVENY